MVLEIKSTSKIGTKKTIKIKKCVFIEYIHCFLTTTPLTLKYGIEFPRVRGIRHFGFETKNPIK